MIMLIMFYHSDSSLAQKNLCDVANVKILKDDSCVAAAALNAQLSQKLSNLRVQVNKSFCRQKTRMMKVSYVE